MKANELRIGNLIQANGPVMEVKAITKHDVELYLHGCESDNWDEDLENCTGILLTPEILERCGFWKNKMGEYCIEVYDIATHLELMEGKYNFYYPQFTQTPEGSDERTVFFNRINSLHQLQNLIFALTNEELKVQEGDASKDARGTESRDKKPSPEAIGEGEKERCEYELIVEKYFGIKLTKQVQSLTTNDHILVDLVCAAHQHFTKNKNI